GLREYRRPWLGGIVLPGKMAQLVNQGVPGLLIFEQVGDNAIRRRAQLSRRGPGGRHRGVGRAGLGAACVLSQGHGRYAQHKHNQKDTEPWLKDVRDNIDTVATIQTEPPFFMSERLQRPRHRSYPSRVTSTQVTKNPRLPAQGLPRLETIDTSQGRIGRTGPHKRTPQKPLDSKARILRVITSCTAFAINCCKPETSV